MKNRKGFTLIELLVVVAIIGVLATIVIGSLSSARNKAQGQKVEKSLKTTRDVLEIYNIDNNAYPTIPQSGTAMRDSIIQHGNFNQNSIIYQELLAYNHDLRVELEPHAEKMQNLSYIADRDTHFEHIKTNLCGIQKDVPYILYNTTTNSEDFTPSSSAKGIEQTIGASTFRYYCFTL